MSLLEGVSTEGSYFYVCLTAALAIANHAIVTAAAAPSTSSSTPVLRDGVGATTSTSSPSPSPRPSPILASGAASTCASASAATSLAILLMPDDGLALPRIETGLAARWRRELATLPVITLLRLLSNEIGRRLYIHHPCIPSRCEIAELREEGHVVAATFEATVRLGASHHIERVKHDGADTAAAAAAAAVAARR